MKWRYPIAIAGLFFLGAGCTKTNVVSTAITPQAQNVISAKVTDADGGNETVKSMKKEKADSVTEQQQSPPIGAYQDYSPETVTALQGVGKKVVLFFYAQWCPYCRTADAAFRAHPEKILTGYVVLKTNYDSESVLKKKYGVTSQHTFVQIDNGGNLVSKWVSGDIDTLAQNVK